MKELLDLPFNFISWVSHVSRLFEGIDNAVTGWEDDDDGVGRCVFDRPIGE